jgi:hypothetical protein
MSAVSDKKCIEVLSLRQFKVKKKIEEKREMQMSR